MRPVVTLLVFALALPMTAYGCGASTAAANTAPRQDSAQAARQRILVELQQLQRQMAEQQLQLERLQAALSELGVATGAQSVELERRALLEQRDLAIQRERASADLRRRALTEQQQLVRAEAELSAALRERNNADRRELAMREELLAREMRDRLSADRRELAAREELLAREMRLRADAEQRERTEVQRRIEAELRARRGRDTLVIPRRDTLASDAARRSGELAAYQRTAERVNAMVRDLGASNPDLALGLVKPAWAPSDPADSLYRAAVASLTRGDYELAATVFQQITARYPTSEYAADAYYYRAMALYRLGGQNDLKAAITSLDTLVNRFSERSAQTDVGSLRTRILGRMATRGDTLARSTLERAVREEPGECNRVSLSEQLSAMSALASVSPDSAAPAIRALLSRRDECSASLRGNAILLVSKLQPDDQLAILSEVVRNEPVSPVRASALMWLGRLPLDRTLPLMQELLRSSRESSMHDHVVVQLAAHDDARAVSTIVEAIQAPHISTRTKVTAIRSLESSGFAEARAAAARVRQNLDEQTLRALSVTDVEFATRERMREQIARAAVDTARRELAVGDARRVDGAAASAPIAQVVSRYDSSRTINAKLLAIEVLGTRSEPQAADKLVTIARDTAATEQLRVAAIRALASKSDARSRRLLLELISR